MSDIIDDTSDDVDNDKVSDSNVSDDEDKEMEAGMFFWDARDIMNRTSQNLARTL